MKFNKKIIEGTILLSALVLLLSTIAYAKPFTEAFKGGLVEINNFFTGEAYKPYAKTIDFFFFGILFTAIYMMGARYAFKEVKKPEQVIVILLGLMTSFLLVLGGWSATLLLPYINWFLYALLFIFYFWLLKGIKNKFWRFILALLLTVLTVALLQGLFGSVTAPDSQGFFSSFGRSFGPIQFPEISGFPQVPTSLSNLFGALPPVTTPTETPPVTPTTTPKEVAPGTQPEGTAPFGTTTAAQQPPQKPSGWPWWVWILLALLLAVGGFLGWKNRDKLKNLFRRRERPAAEQARPAETVQPAQLTIEQILNQINEYLAKKKELLLNIYKIYKIKRNIDENFIDLYHKAVSDVEAPYLLDPDHPSHQKIEQIRNEDVKNLIKAELELERQLQELLKIEFRIAGHGEGYGDFKNETKIEGDADKWASIAWKKFNEIPEMESRKSEFRKGYYNLTQYIAKLKDSSKHAIVVVQDYMKLTSKHVESEKQLGELLKPEQIEEWMKTARIEKWKNLIGMKATAPRDFRLLMGYLYGKEGSNEIDGEILFLKKILFPTINKERQDLKYVGWLIKLLLGNAADKTTIQDLVIEPKEATEGGVVEGTPISISTKVAQGPGPFKAYCFIYRYVPYNIIRHSVARPGQNIPMEGVGLAQIDPPKPDYTITEISKETYLALKTIYDGEVEKTAVSIEAPLLPATFPKKGFAPGKYKVVVYVKGHANLDKSTVGRNELDYLNRYDWDKKEKDVTIYEKHQPWQIIIKKPVNNALEPRNPSVHRIDEFIDNLEAEVIGLPGDMVNDFGMRIVLESLEGMSDQDFRTYRNQAPGWASDVNPRIATEINGKSRGEMIRIIKENTAKMSFVWYVAQGPVWFDHIDLDLNSFWTKIRSPNSIFQRIHVGRRGPHNITSMPISRKFKPGPAKLGVFLFDEEGRAGRQIAAIDVTDIILEDNPRGPREVPRMRINLLRERVEKQKNLMLRLLERLRKGKKPDVEEEELAELEPEPLLEDFEEESEETADDISRTAAFFRARDKLMQRLHPLWIGALSLINKIRGLPEERRRRLGQIISDLTDIGDENEQIRRELGEEPSEREERRVPQAPSQSEEIVENDENRENIRKFLEALRRAMESNDTR